MICALVELPQATLQVAIVEGHQITDEQGYERRARYASRLDDAKPRLFREVVVHVEIDTHKAAIAVLAVVNRRVGSEEIAVVVVLVGRGDVGLAGSNLLQPAIRVFLAQLEWLHIARCAQLVCGAEVAGGGGIENEAGNAVLHCHRVDVKQIGVGGVETHQGRERGLIKFGAVIGRVQQSMMQIAVHCTAGELADLPDMHAQHLPAGLPRQHLRDQDDGQENGGGDGGRDDEDVWPERTWSGCPSTLC